MIDGPWLAFAGAGGGWVLAGSILWYFYHRISEGTLITKREADAYQERIRSQDDTIKDLRNQNLLMLREGLPLQNALIESLRKAAQK
jgi:hypothetical protein